MHALQEDMSMDQKLNRQPDIGLWFQSDRQEDTSSDQKSALQPPWLWRDWYILDASGNPIPVTNASQMDEFWQSDRHIGNTERDGIQVSTVFLGLNHSFGHIGPPVLWETMIFGSEFDGEQERYTSRSAALAGHAAWVAKVFAEEETLNEFLAKVDRIIAEVEAQEEASQ
jgi:hypothetical protein